MPISHLLSESFYSQDQFPSHENINNNHNSIDHVMTQLRSGLNISKPQHQQPQLISSQEKFVLIDTDAGTDDAWAILMALAAKRCNLGVNIVGITTVYGSTSVENVVTNVTQTLAIVHENHIPIYKGMNSSMVGKYSHNKTPICGMDGFGDAGFPQIPKTIQPEHAVDAIIKFAEAYPGKLTIMCLGPLTNLAMAIKLRPDLKNLVKELYIVGGNTEGLGNITMNSEFNFFVDPEAAQVVLEDFSVPCAINILPWETCAKYGTFSHGWRTSVIGNMRTEEVKLLNKIEANILATYKESWLASDAILAACLINPNMATRTESYHCSVELSGQHTRGMMIVDKTFMQEKLSNASVIAEIDREIYETMLIWAVGGPVYSH